jgi:hypothetical protein
MEIEIDNIATSKQMINICRANADGTLTVVATKKLFVTYDLSENTTTCNYKGVIYNVDGDIYMQYIIVP